MNKRRLLKLLAILTTLIVMGTACSRSSYDLLDVTPIPLEVPDGSYQDIAWLELKAVAMDYMPTADTHNVQTQLIIVDLVSGESYLLPDQIPSDCFETRYGRINRLPDGRLGYLWECIPHQGIARDYRLHEGDQVTHTDRELYRYPIPFWATAFSFAPDMSQWLQEKTGDGLFNELHYVVPNEPPVRLLEDSFARAGHPAWLPDGRIIFAGTPQLPESKTNVFSGLPGITAGLRQPWSIYLTDLESLLSGDVGEDDILLSGIRYIKAVKVSPNGRDLSFLGTVDQKVGLWIYRMDTGELARIWAGFGPYDWSPNGKEIIVLVREPDAETFRGRPALIELPHSLSN
jgi:hypothetical protein